ncbi:MAG: CBS domain-containing protein [Acidimicrobiales bacterium]
MLISSIVSEKGQDVVTIDPDRTISDALQLLREHNFGALVVSSDGNRIDGIISERDVVRRLCDDPGTLDRSVRELMTSSVITCTPDDVVTSVMSQMTEHHFRHMPVVDKEGTLSGIISIGDVVKWRLNELEEQWTKLQEYMASGR